MKVAHPATVTIRAGPVGVLGIPDGAVEGSPTPTQLAWPLLRVLLRHVALGRSVMLTCVAPSRRAPNPSVPCRFRIPVQESALRVNAHEILP